jgi:hypothetical protein
VPALLEANGRDVVRSLSNFEKSCAKNVRVVKIFSIMQHIHEDLVQLVMFAVELLIVTRLVGVVDALTAHEKPEALVWWALRLNVMFC